MIRPDHLAPFVAHPKEGRATHVRLALGRQSVVLGVALESTNAFQRISLPPEPLQLRTEKQHLRHVLVENRCLVARHRARCEIPIQMPELRQQEHQAQRRSECSLACFAADGQDRLAYLDRRVKNRQDEDDLKIFKMERLADAWPLWDANLFFDPPADRLSHRQFSKWQIAPSSEHWYMSTLDRRQDLRRNRHRI